jgi:hypothetical protein
MNNNQNNENNEIKTLLLKNQDFDSNNLITKKFTLNKETYKNLTLMALDKFYDVDANKLNTIELTSSLLSELINEAFIKYKQEKFK